MNHLGLVQTVDRLGQGVVVAVALAAHRWRNTRFCEPFAVANADVLRPPVGMVDVGALALILRPNARARIRLNAHWVCERTSV